LNQSIGDMGMLVIIL